VKTTRQPQTAKSRAFGLMLDVKRALVFGMLTYGEGRFTMLESSEDDAAGVLEKALAAAERRGAGRTRPRRRRPTPSATTTITLVKTTIDAERRKRKGAFEYRMACDRCGAVRWLPQVDVGTPHCVRGSFGFLLKRPAARA